MDITNTIAVIILGGINTTLGALILMGKLRIVRVYPEKLLPAIAEVVAPTVEKRKRGRPRKSKTHYLHLPPTLSETQLADATQFFDSFRSKSGDRVVLHLAKLGGAEETIEVPYPVQWDSQVKERFSERLGGWV
jgi:hypothetical protein